MAKLLSRVSVPIRSQPEKFSKEVIRILAAYMRQNYKSNPPIIIVVEPDKADCYYQSFASKEGNREIVTGEMNTIMAGLPCGEPNIRAFRLLRQYAKGSFSCNDNITALGMRVYGNPLKSDPRVVSGESGAVTYKSCRYRRAKNKYSP